MIQRSNSSLISLLAPKLKKNRGEAHWMPLHVVAPHNAAKEPVLLVTTGGGGLAVTLPLAANQLAKVYAIKQLDAAPGTVDITTQGPDLIDGVPVYQLTAQFEAVIIVSDGITDWWIISWI